MFGLAREINFKPLMFLNVQIKWNGNLIKYCKNCVKMGAGAANWCQLHSIINADVFIIGDDNSYKCINSDKMIIDN